MFDRKRKVVIVAGAIAIATALGGAAIALNSPDREEPITGNALEKAGRAAIEHTGGGRVSETEVGDEDGYYEVEVTLDNGRQVDVHLDQEFNVIGDEADDESPGNDPPTEGSNGELIR